jgi:hypothetical protein
MLRQISVNFGCVWVQYEHGLDSRIVFVNVYSKAVFLKYIRELYLKCIFFSTTWAGQCQWRPPRVSSTRWPASPTGDFAARYNQYTNSQRSSNQRLKMPYGSAHVGRGITPTGDFAARCNQYINSQRTSNQRTKNQGSQHTNSQRTSNQRTKKTKVINIQTVNEHLINEQKTKVINTQTVNEHLINAQKTKVINTQTVNEHLINEQKKPR